MNLRFGILWPFRNPEFARLPWVDLYKSHLDLISESEAMGYDNAWLTEHHFVDDGYSPSLMSIAGAYWRGDEKNKQLTRIYGITFPKQKYLTEYL